MRNIRTAVLGAGNMGTAMAHALAGNGHELVLWDFFPDVLEDICKNRTNGRFLPGVLLHDNVHACVSRDECVAGAELVIICIPSRFLISSVSSVLPAITHSAIILNVAKGFAPGSRQPMPIALAELAPGHPMVHLAGPTLASELAQSMAAGIVLASEKEDAARQVADWFAGPSFMPTTTTDVIGAAFGGILKNVYAILFGYLSKQSGDSRNLESCLTIACMREMTTISESCGAEKETLYGLAGLGDLIATGFSQYSHNRKFGQKLGNGLSVSELEEQLGWLPEGARSAETVCLIAREKEIAAPLAGFVHRLLKGDDVSYGDFLKILRNETG